MSYVREAPKHLKIPTLTYLHLSGLVAVYVVCWVNEKKSWWAWWGWWVDELMSWWVDEWDERDERRESAMLWEIFKLSASSQPVTWRDRDTHIHHWQHKWHSFTPPSRPNSNTNLPYRTEISKPLERACQGLQPGTSSFWLTKLFRWIETVFRIWTIWYQLCTDDRYLDNDNDELSCLDLTAYVP